MQKQNSWAELATKPFFYGTGVELLQVLKRLKSGFFLKKNSNMDSEILTQMAKKIEVEQQPSIPAQIAVFGIWHFSVGKTMTSGVCSSCSLFQYFVTFFDNYLFEWDESEQILVKRVATLRCSLIG